MNPETHTCDCGYTWRHGQSGAHSCGQYYRQTIAELRAAAPVQAQEPVNFKDTSFGQHLEKCSKEVAGWPAWKRDMWTKHRAPVKPVAVPDGVRWDLFPGWLIDHCEGHVITEEKLQSELYSMLKSDTYLAAPAAQGDAKDAERYRWLRDESLGDDQIGAFTPYVIQGQLGTCIDGVNLDAIIDAAIAAKAAS